MRGKLIGILMLLMLGPTLRLSAHVGSPDVYYEGNAGSYRLFVSVRVPQVIPGIAEIEVRSAAADVQSVRIVPMRLSGPGSNLPPIPDLAQRSQQDPQFFIGSLWLMESGALQVRVTADGSKGQGELSVPVPAFAQQTLPMSRPLEALLFAMVLFLAVGAISIAGAAVREGSLEAGEPAKPLRVRRARIAMVIATVTVAVVGYLGNVWWNAEARAFDRGINFYKPPLAQTTLENGQRLVIRGEGQDPRWSQRVKMENVISDHGHLMHLFLVRLPDMQSMWHLHPERIEGGAFAENLPAMPAGRYKVFADIVDQAGFPWTLVGEVDLPQIAGPTTSGDDSSWSGAPLVPQAQNPTTMQLADGGRIVWQRGDTPLHANVPMEFKFRVEDKEGKPALNLEPYMGMAGHAEFVSSELNVFAHVHPAGSVSMAALDLARGAKSRDVAAPQMLANIAMPMTSGPLPPEVSFPYGFPHPGDYRIFVQIKLGGQIQSAAFDAHVQ
jgi:hypothetical protein